LYEELYEALYNKVLSSRQAEMTVKERMAKMDAGERAEKKHGHSALPLFTLQKIIRLIITFTYVAEIVSNNPTYLRGRKAIQRLKRNKVCVLQNFQDLFHR
jgi:hypothetical protein